MISSLLLDPTEEPSTSRAAILSHYLAVSIFSGALIVLYGPKILPLVALAVISTTIHNLRRAALGLACVVNLVLIDAGDAKTAQHLLHLLPFFVFNALFILLADRVKAFGRHYLVFITAMVLVLIGIQIAAEQLYDHSKLATRMTMPIILNFWTYMNYVKVPLTGLTYVEKVIWLRPFWFRWIIPFGSNVEIKRGLFEQTKVNVRQFQRFALITLFLVVGLFFYENLFFEKQVAFAKASWLPNLLTLPLLSTQGYGIAFDRFPIETGTLVAQQSWTFLLLQVAAVVHFLLYIGAYSSTAITLAVLAGFDIPLHVQAFWRARNFSEFYLKTTFHYSYLLRTHLMPAFARMGAFGLKGRSKQAWTIAASIFVASAVSLLFGRSHWLGRSVDMATRLHMTLHQLQYPMLVALLCAANLIFYRRVQLSNGPLRLLFILAYFFIFQLTLVFGFQFLRTDSLVKLEFAISMLKIFNPFSYIN